MPLFTANWQSGASLILCVILMITSWGKLTGKSGLP